MMDDPSASSQIPGHNFIVSCFLLEVSLGLVTALVGYL